MPFDDEQFDEELFDLEQEEDEQEDDAEALLPARGALVSPHAREISLSEIKRAHTEPGPGGSPEGSPAFAQRPAALSAGRSSTEAPSQRVNFAALAEWVGLGLRTVGKERTLQAVETYAGAGYVGPEVQKTLVQLLTLSPEEGPLEPSSPTATIELLVKLDGLLNAR